MATFQNRIVAWSMAALGAVVVGLLLASGPARSDQKLTVVTTVGMVTDITRAVAGDRATVIGLMGEGVDPHLYKPSRADVQQLMKADVVLYNGLLLEGKMTDALIRVATSGRKVHAVTELLDEQFLIEPKDLDGHQDPHVWMDPLAWAKAVEVVRDKLSEADPAGKESYRANAAAYLKQLDELHVYAKQALESVTESRRVLVTAHDAFNYFGRRYGYEVVGIQGISTESEAGLKDVERIVKLLVDQKVGAVFVESTVSDRNIRALLAGSRAKGHEVKIGGELFSDAMGAPGTYVGTYIGMIDHNVTTIARALGGRAPERGMAGKLSK